MSLRNIILGLVSVPFLLLANIVEMKHFREINSYIDSTETLIVFDIDNTLLEANGHLGSVAWGDYVASDLESKGISKEEAQEVVSVLWRAVQPHISVKPVDREAAAVIRDIQGCKVKMMCLTARTPQEVTHTLKQLDSIGIDMKVMAPVKEDTEINTLNRLAYYTHGILFATPLNKKSEVFTAFVKRHKLPFKKVVFVDDKLHHVQDMKEALSQEGIECIPIHFTGADEHVRQFDPAAAELQWKNFQKINNKFIHNR